MEEREVAAPGNLPSQQAWRVCEGFFPQGSKDQIRRAAQSVTSNIAEGFGRDDNREFIQFLSDAKGSCGEVRDQLYTALDERYVSGAEFGELHQLAAETSRLISGFMKHLQQSELRGPKFKRPAAA